MVDEVRFATKRDVMLYTRTENGKYFNLFMATSYPDNALVIGDFSAKQWRDSLNGLDDADVMVRVLNHESLHYVLNKWAGKDRDEYRRLSKGVDLIIESNLTKAFDQAMVLLGRNGLFQYIQYAVGNNMYNDFAMI